MRVLLSTPSAQTRRLLKECVQNAGFSVAGQSDAEIDVALLDLPGSDAADVGAFRAAHPGCEVILLARDAAAIDAAQAVRAGAFHCLGAPYGQGDVVFAIWQAARSAKLARECARLKGAAEGAATTKLPLAEIERRAILDRLRECGGNRAATARSLGVSEKTIYNKLKRYKLG
ncbi:MAG: helix-turn-helix domain-containing protein [Planctomycetaceae bacterium]